MPKISIIVPVYNVESYLNRCVASILNQSFKDFELILVDDGSPDNCPQLCDDFAKKDSRIIVIHKENGGLSDARNKGLDYIFENSNSEWVTFIDSDDWIHKDYLKILYESCIENNVLISVCGYKKTNFDNIIDINNVLDKKKYTSKKLYFEKQTNFTVAWGKLYKKELFIKNRYPFGKIHEDEFLTYKLLFACNDIVYISNSLYYYYENLNSIVNSKISNNKIDIIDAYWSQVCYAKENIKDNEIYYSFINHLVVSFGLLLSFPKKKYNDYNVFKFELTKKYIELRPALLNLPMRFELKILVLIFPKTLFPFKIYQNIKSFIKETINKRYL